MDIAATSGPVAPWIGVGVLLASAAWLLAALVVVLVTRRRRSAERPVHPPPHDDLATFLDFPPGSAECPRPVGEGVVGLSGPPRAPAAPPPPQPVRAGLPAALSGLAVLLLVAAGGLAAVATPDDRRDAADRSGRDRAAAPSTGSPPTEVRMRFAGVVLEERAVGVTATYPEVELTVDDGGPVARVTLPTWNCLSGEAPDDPVAAGCAPSRTEHAQLRAPDLLLVQHDGGLRFAGEFPTSTRPGGGPPEATGRVRPIQGAVTAGSAQPGRWAPADGELTIGNRRTGSVAGRVRVAA